MIILDDGKAVYSHHAGDPLNTGTQHDAWDCLLILECGNDKIKAVNKIKEELGIEPTKSEIPPWIRTEIERGFDLIRYTYTDEGNACRFEDECREWLIFDKFTQRWFAWMGNYWKPAEELIIKAARFVGRTVICERKYQTEVSNEFLRHAKNAENLKSQQSMVKMAKANMSINLPEETDYTLLACKNGIINCSTGDFYPLEKCNQFRSQYPTAYVDVSYIPNSNPVKWINHLETVMTDNSTEGLTETERENRKENLVAYLLRLFGYSLYAGNPERIFVFCWGKGRNGKSTTMQVLTSVLGTQSANPTLTQLYAVDTDKPAPSIAAALPKRLSIFSEAEGESKISVSAFKEITGETSTERFRMMRQNNQRIPIICLPVATTNDIPQFDKPMDQALLNRLVTIPFNHIFESENREVFDDLMTEKDEIFSKMVDELKEYLKHRLIPAPECTSTTQQELLIGDDLYVFLTQVIEPSTSEKMTKNDVKAKYLQWATDSGIEVNTHFELDIYGQKYKVLNKSEITRLYTALKIMGYKEGKNKGERYIYARIHTVQKEHQCRSIEFSKN